jgi:small membrane protein
VFYVAAKVFSVILAVIAISKSYVDLRARSESVQMFIFWVVTWTMIVLVALFPAIIDVLIATSGYGRTGLGTVFGMGLVFLFFVVYRIYVKMERVEQKLTKTIQELALKDQVDRRSRS